MKDVQETCRIAVIQAEPVMFDKAGGLKKALRCIRNAAFSMLDTPPEATISILNCSERDL